MKLFKLATSLLLTAIFAGCSVTNFDVSRTPSQAIDASEQTSLGQRYEALEQTLPDHSLFYPLTAGTDALGARLRLIDTAQKSIDMQYFLMKDDMAGNLVMARLLKAADRGVRVRILLDDIFSTVRDDELLVLNAHDNIEVRLFNPISRFGFKNINFLADFTRANRRMHNKSFTVDGAITIVGGRNIADEYFDLGYGGKFFDLDVVAFGPATDLVADSFDEFWNFKKSIPIEHVKKPLSPAKLASTREDIIHTAKTEAKDAYTTAINSQLILDMADRKVDGFEARATLISEDPSKLSDAVSDRSTRLIYDIVELVNNAKQEVLVVTPYFVPTKSGMAFWRDLSKRNIDITIVTNSLASTNHVPVHAAYDRYRKPILELGITLLEIRPDALSVDGTHEVSKEHSTLHSKLILVDQRYAFIGSLNLDPRSIEINTEMGLLIDSPEMAEWARQEATITYDMLYKLELDDNGDIQWIETNGAQQRVYSKDPQSSGFRRFLSWLYKVLPESQL